MGIAAPDGRYTVGQAIEDWLRDGLDGRAEKTVTLNRGALKPFADRIGKRPLRELTAQDVRQVLTDIAATHSSRTVVVAHAGTRQPEPASPGIPVRQAGPAAGREAGQ